MIKQINRPKESRNGYNTVATSVNTSGNTIIKGNTVNVIDNLNSTSKLDALSANQGNVLNNKLNNIYSEVDNKFLSKQHTDTANGLIVFDKGLMSNGNIAIGGYAINPDYGVGIWKNSGEEWEVETDNLTARQSVTSPIVVADDNIRSNQYIEDKIGFSLYKDNKGKYNLDIDNANIRGRLDVKVLQIEEAKYIGGRLYCTKAGFKISDVKDEIDFYRCYFNNKDGDTIIHNQFEMGDLAFCQTFNNNKLRRWWRQVVSVGTDYIDVSKDFCELNSDIPLIGDDVVQLGNIVNTERQGALIIQPLELNIYNGIKDYTLPQPIISLNPTTSKITGQFINQVTNEDITTTFTNLYDRIDAEAQRVVTDENGNITNINTSGLLIKDDFSSLYSEAVNADDNVVKRSEISTFITTDEANNLISNAQIEADKINFIGKTIINNNFTVDEQGNLDINGKITTTEGKIGNFNITKNGLSNDAKDGLASILITDSRTEPEVGFSLGVNPDNVCSIYSRVNNVLDCSSEYGTAIKAYSRSGWGLTASKTKVEGLHVSPIYIPDTEGDVTLSLYTDFVIFGNKNPMTVSFPQPSKSSGKIYTIKKIGAGTVTLTGDIVKKEKASVDYNYELNGCIPIQFICDGLKWFEI